jgi:hypothetical protein
MHNIKLKYFVMTESKGFMKELKDLGTGGSHLQFLASQEAEMRSIAVQSQSRQIVHKTLS